MSLVLASASTARARLLQAAGVEVEAVPAQIDEVAVKAAMLHEGAPARDIADTLAELKAMRVSARRPGAWVLGADQVLVADGTLFDKPSAISEARAQLASLRGRRHELLSAAVIVRDGESLWRHVGRARLAMRPFSDAFLENYLEQVGGAVLTSVGAYHLEGLGAQLFAAVEGDYFSVLGLPLLEVLGYLRMQGVLVE